MKPAAYKNNFYETLKKHVFERNQSSDTFMQNKDIIK